jgi:hypothetical protein
MKVMQETGKILLKPNEKLAGISKEYHVRKQGGKYLAYLVLDMRSMCYSVKSFRQSWM